MAEREDDARAKAVEAARQLAEAHPGLDVRVSGTWVWVSGDTRPVCGDLKARGLRWAPKKQQWFLRGTGGANRRGMSWEYIVRKYGAEKPEEVAA